MENKSYPVADVMLESLNHIDYLSRKIKDSQLAALENWRSADCVRKATEKAVIKEIAYMEAAFNAGKSGQYQSYEDFHTQFMMEKETPLNKDVSVKRAYGKSGTKSKTPPGAHCEEA
jgi:ABC-type sulfate transport system substrate-binding protein